MAKRRNRAPNIPAETLERARQQARGVTEEVPVEKPVETKPAPVQSAPATRTRTERRSEVRSSTAGSSRRANLQSGQPGRRTRNIEDMSPEMISNILAHPTKIVTEEELHQQYGYVLTDLRNMFLLAAALFAALILLAIFFIR
jgi:hypothetical protein